MEPRKPTIEEEKDIISATGQDYDIVHGSAVAVFDNYITDGPGYSGKVISIVWPGSPAFCNVYIYRDGKLVEILHE